MAGAFIVLFLFIGVVGFMVFVVVRQLKKTDASMVGAVADTTKVETTQDYLPFDKIENNIIDLGGFKYRMIIECSSTNYNLKTAGEREMIEASFQRFLNSLQFPITFYVQTKEIDNSKMLAQLEKDIQETLQNFPNLSEYGEVYLKEMRNLNSYIGNSKQKKKYIIVPYDEAASLTDLNKEEKYEYAMKELNTRTSMIIDGLAAAGIKGTVMQTKDLIELVYSIFHKDDYANFEHVFSGEYLTLTVDGRNILQEMTDYERANHALYEAQKIIKNEILSKILVEEDAEVFNEVVGKLQEMSNKLMEVDKKKKDANEATDENNMVQIGRGVK